MKALRFCLCRWQSGALDLLLSCIVDGCVLHFDSVDQMRIASVVDTCGLREYVAGIIVSPVPLRDLCIRYPLQLMYDTAILVDDGKRPDAVLAETW